jgi:hypothetical protein
LALASIGTARAQSNKVAVTVAVQTPDGPYQFKGPAICFHMASTTVSGVSGQNWQVAHQEGERSLILSVVRPASGGEDMFSLHVLVGGNKYVTNTVAMRRGTVKMPTQGSGSIRFEPAGTGGTFTIDATAVNGSKISGTVKCEAFPERLEVGGN